jgi:AI-2 transport protein TqsA
MQASEGNERGAWPNPVATGALVILALLASIAALRSASDVMIPFAMALFLAALSAPLVSRLGQRIPRPAAVAAIVAAVILVCMGAASFVTFCARAISARGEFYAGRLQGLIERLQRFADRFGVSVERDLVDPVSVVSLITDGLASFFSSLGQFVVFLFFFAFLLVELPDFDRKLARAYPNSAAAGTQVFASVSDRLFRFFGALTLISALTGFGTALWCWVCGLDFPFMWGGLAFVLNYIPYFGSIAAVAAAFLVALLQFDGLLRPMLVLVGLLVVQNVLGNYYAPRAFGRSVLVSPLVVFFAMILWGWVWGPVGMLLSVPLTACLKIVFENIPALRPWAVLLGPALVPPEHAAEPAEIPPLAAGEQPVA